MAYGTNDPISMAKVSPSNMSDLPEMEHVSNGLMYEAQRLLNLVDSLGNRLYPVLGEQPMTVKELEKDVPTDFRAPMAKAFDAHVMMVRGANDILSDFLRRLQV